MAGIAVAGPNVYSVQAGGQLAAIGGNAVDAAIAAIFSALVSEPGIASLGGGAFVTVAAPGQPAVTIDGSVAMPGSGRPESAFGRGLDPLHLDYGGGTDTDVGPGSVAIPGTLVALELAHRRFGRAPWPEVVGPAAALARKGFRIGLAAGNYLAYSAEPLFGRDPSARAALTGGDGQPLRTGDTVWMPELGDFLDQVIKEGAAALHRGETARALVAEMAAHDGLITLADLEGYRAVVRPALGARIGGWQWATNPPPAVGGTVFTAMLLLAQRSLGSAWSAGSSGSSGSGRSPGSGGDRLALAELIDLQRAVLSHRVRYLDAARSSSDRTTAAEQLIAGIAAQGAGWPGSPSEPGSPFRPGSPSTVHVSSVDAGGLACAVTASSGYGAGVSVPGTGVWLNNCLGERELNRLGPHALAPGDRLVSNMTPTVGRHDDGRVLAIGSPGADRITTAVLQVVLGLLAGDSLTQAIERPRVHVSVDDAGRPKRVEYEADLPRSAPGSGSPPAADLPWREHAPRAMFFGGVAAALRGPDGRLEAAADPRREGGVVVA